MSHGAGQVDVAEALAAHLAGNDLDAALLADDAAMLHALVFAAVALVVLGRTEDLGAEQPVALRLEGPVVDGLGFFDFTEGALANLLRRSDGQPDSVKAKRVLGAFKKAKDVFQNTSSL